jgi:hypothetical protein
VAALRLCVANDLLTNPVLPVPPNDLEVMKMELSVQDRIRERAYQLWDANGRVEGHAEQHWLTAEREILAEHLAPSAVVPAKARAPRSRSRSRSKAA